MADKDGEGCLFCDVFAAGDDHRAYILHRSQHAFVILNLFPYSNGHLMVVFNRHLATFAATSTEERGEMMDLATLCEAVLMESYQPDGLNVGLNLGRAAGAGVVGHLHLHVVPRWVGDTNFATVIGETRIIPEAPEQTYERLQPLFASRTGGAS